MQIRPNDNQPDSIQNRGEVGLDKVKLFLHQHLWNHGLLKQGKWHYDSNGRTRLHSLKSNKNLLIEKAGANYFFIINQEFFNHTLPAPYNNILLQVCDALHCLALEGFMQKQLSLQLYLPYIHHITELEIYFSLKNNYFMILDERSFNTTEEARENNGLYQYAETETYYSYNDSGNSSVCLYNKQEKDFHDRHYAEKEIKGFHYPYRLEFRLRGNDVSNIFLLDAPFNTVFTNYLPTLAFLHNKFIKNNIVMNLPLRNKYQRVIKNSERTTSIRHRQNGAKNRKVKTMEIEAISRFDNSSDAV